MITIDDLLDAENLDLAIRHLLSKRDSCGIDNIFISEFKAYWEANGNTICEEIRNETFIPNIILEKEIINYDGKHRIISQHTCTDRLILRALEQILHPVCENIFLDCSHAYRDDHSVETAVRMASGYISDGRPWVAEIDIDHFFDSISISKMEKVLDDYLELDPSLKTLIVKYLHCRIERDGEILQKQTGLVQGSPISPLLSNLYLTSLDSNMQKNNLAAVRFADDIRIYTETDTGASDALNQIQTWLSLLDLHTNKDKSGVYGALHRRFLGYYFEKDSSGAIIATKKKKKNTHYTYWHKSAIQRVNHNYHIVNDGILSKKDYCILFENEDGKKYLSVEVVDSINVYSDAVFSPQFFNFLASKRLRLTLFDKYGRSIGYFNSSKYTSSGKTMIKQAAVYLDEKKRLEMARKIIIGAMHNIRANLRYYCKQKGDDVVSNALNEISKVITSVNEASNLDTLMLLEARGRETYYNTFNSIISNPGFKFTRRTKRPPKDPLNAMISFGNVFLYNKLATDIHKTSLDIRIGFLHSTNSRSESLNLDIAELFKPLIVDRAIFTLVNKRMIDPDRHFNSVSGGGVYLNKEGKQLFIEELEKKMYQKVKFNGNDRTYEYIMREEIQKILRYVLYDQKYKPYKYTT